ncbi:hypothetical protein GLAREA_11325 [Glarea lozoyensis ATCC 20868]|uniref:Uncharacterized protein n=1 Tax=Glarea lozoyensis (strain ATCC 20868 / MF5171) TaxID=1116229 RepID=S3DD16_GLAL2|nr:uncharacterized protein GLAREA_11325 [Glarea lozoyensis ATCC 20868]EPE35625.1 hypothetical protein GLAREA_11325 [Glarea lozoyensis ATCC 20868]
MQFPLHSATRWSPFKLDALGLVTLLGAEEVSNAVGALEHSRYAEYLPLFGTYLVAANKFTAPIPGYVLYNITDGVFVPILNGWFSRWLIANLTSPVTILEWQVVEKRSSIAKRSFAAIIGLLLNGALLAMTVMQGDWYGLANSIAMAVSVLVRSSMVHESRTHLDQMVNSYEKQEKQFLKVCDQNEVKVVIVTPDNKVVAFKIQRGLLSCIFVPLDLIGSKKKAKTKQEMKKHIPPKQTIATVLTDEEADLGIKSEGKTELVAGSTPDKPKLKPTKTEAIPEKTQKRHSHIYTTCRAFGWFFFACHVVTIGLSTLPTQLLSIALLLSATLLAIYRVGNDDAGIGSRIIIRKKKETDAHKEAYLYLDPTPRDEQIMRKYLLLPHEPEVSDTILTWSDDWWRQWNIRTGRVGNANGH